MEVISVLDENMLIDRTLTSRFNDISNAFPVVLITGPRQVGKTTLLEQCMSKTVTYVTLDSLTDRALAQEDPTLFLQRYPPPVVIDEIQYAPGLFSAIKLAVDKRRQTGLFWLTGSQKFHLMRGVSESLAGRVAVLDLLGLSLAEIHGQAADSPPFLPNADYLKSSAMHGRPSSLMQIFERIWTGSFPAVVLNPKMDRELFYKSYLQTYVERDVRDLARVGDEGAFVRFLRAAAARTGQLLNIAEMARDVGVDAKTARSWLSILETSGLIYLLQPYHSNLSKRLVKAPKLYFLDTGLCCHLTRWTSAAVLEAGAMSGALLETFVIAEILKSYWHNAKCPVLYFYRDKDQKEVDLLIEQDGQFYPVEIKKTASPNVGMIKSFKTMEKRGMTIGPGAVVCLVDHCVPITRGVDAIPVGYI